MNPRTVLRPTASRKFSPIGWNEHDKRLLLPKKRRRLSELRAARSGSGAHTALTELPVENNCLASCAQKYLIVRLLTNTPTIGTTPIPIPNSP